MPQGDRTGPEGFGPRTGRRAGFCTGNEEPGFYRVSGRGSGRGFSRGRRLFSYPHSSYGSNFNNIQEESNISKEAEVTFLKNHAEALKNELDIIEQKISTLETSEK